MITGPLAGQARRTAHLIASRLADAGYVADRVAASTADPNTSGARRASSLLAGDAGIAMVLRLASEADPESGDHWRRAAHGTLTRAVRSTHDRPLFGHGIVGGSAGLALALSEFAAGDQRYQRPLDSLHTRLADQLGARDKPAVGSHASIAEYDALQGAAGTLGYLLSVPGPDAALRDGVHGLVDELVRLCTPAPAEAESRWVVPPEDYPLLPRDLEEYPHGYINLGLAHGIPGPLAALSLAWRAGYRRPGLREAIGNGIALLSSAAVEDGFGIDWPSGIAMDPEGRRTQARHPARTAWCYGAPGIAAALLIAADALEDEELRAYAVAAFEAALRRSEEHIHTLSPTICHGLAGLLAICEVFARTTDSVQARAALPVLTERLLAHCSEDLAFGVQNLERPDLRIDNPDFLCGAAGVAAVLWTVSAPAPRRRWQRALLIA
ncbi:lanthionine synthetase C family protein [Streptomyces sp. NBC_00162]|uniref:lanthionine synthetase C family protein n=1 Tax=Streptomyces sp. NBC_00162 TaxID=2903629 RepID=UPI00214B8306|nr:lanthionine synthetase C family protein [Streptomyces sp. NBC_00162]UUU40176.1 lanthionine synthetase C family protein [Streptomyces sp. NBC_00162]